MMNTLLIAIVSIILSVAAQFSLKIGMAGANVKVALSQPFSIKVLFNVLTDVYIVCGFVLYGLGAIIWLGVLSKWDVSKAYPLVGLGFAFSIAIGFLIGEQVTTSRFIGVALICGGVFMVARS